MTKSMMAFIPCLKIREFCLTRIKQGHLYWVNVDPHAGHEEGGHNKTLGNIRRPVVVASNHQYNQGGMSIVSPITTKNEQSRYLLPILVKRML
ncbi:type II toxin-antitoxin system PemK/MazF family toxin [Levilactobacillus sp. N40-8-2]|uniref:type II toxin-antitoxin system PemK/MazF family toxin n=1 Tax=Levilactobacillus muriae TaxID=3238987 RepID=UPI0038B3BA9B